MNPTLMNIPIKETLASRVYEVAIKTPCDKAYKLSATLGHIVYLKREDLQPVHSFKLRGAYNKIAQLTTSERQRGVITASAGNHAQGVALAAKKLGINALIIMPRTTPIIKIDAVKSYGAVVELVGDSYSDAAAHCSARVKTTGRIYVHPFDDPLVIAGQGTIGHEIIEQVPNVTHIFVPVGGGGLIAGIATYVKGLRPDVKIISVEPEDSNAMQLSIEKKQRVELSHVGIFADGVAVKQVGSHAYEAALDKVDDFITVSTDQICAAIKAIFEDTRSIVEPAGALATAGIEVYHLPSNAIAVAICSGANITFERLQQVAERTLIGSNREAMFAVVMAETPGTLQDFCQRVIAGHNISELSYRVNDRDKAQVLLGVNISGELDKEALTARMRKHHYVYTDLTSDEVAKEHIRHMIGGHGLYIEREHIYRITFPERPGALRDFLQTIGSGWNISLFHYKSAASDTGSVLIGFAANDVRTLEDKLQRTTLSFTNIDEEKSIMTFIRSTSARNRVH